jgi:hypothetical protein
MRIQKFVFPRIEGHLLVTTEDFGPDTIYTAGYSESKGTKSRRQYPGTVHLQASVIVSFNSIKDLKLKTSGAFEKESRKKKK